MNGYDRAYRDPKSPLAPITPRCKSSAFSFEINSDCDMSRCSTRKSSCSDYACRDYSCGDYSCGDYSSGNYSCGDYSCGDYSCDDYSCSLGSSDSCSNTYSSCSSKKNSCQTYSCSPCSSSSQACSSKGNYCNSSSSSIKSNVCNDYSCSLGSSDSCSNTYSSCLSKKNSCPTYSCSSSQACSSKGTYCNSSSSSIKSNACNDYSCSFSNSCNDYSCFSGESSNGDLLSIPSLNFFKSNGPKFRSFTDLHNNPYQYDDCGTNPTKQEFGGGFFTTSKPSKNCIKSNSSCSLNNNYPSFPFGISSSCSRSNSCSDQSTSSLSFNNKSSSCSKLVSSSVLLGFFGSGNKLQVPNISTFAKKFNKIDNPNDMPETKRNILKSIKTEKTEKTDSKPFDPQVNHLLEKAGLSKYKTLFEREEIDCLALSFMKASDLRKLNIQDSDIIRFLQVIKDVIHFFQGKSLS